MFQLVLVLHVLVAVALIILVLMQQGKGAEVGASFGGGASQTFFGSQGSGSFLLKVTGGLAAVFFATSLTLGYFAGHETKVDPLKNLNNMPALPTTQVSTPAAPAASTKPVDTGLPKAGVPLPAEENSSDNKK